MSTIHRLVPAGASLLLAGLCACAAGTAKPVLIDNSSDDTIVFSEVAAIPEDNPWAQSFSDWDKHWSSWELFDDEPGEATEPEPSLPESETVRAITPRLRSAVTQAKRINAHSVGWLQVPGTSIDGVVLQNPATGNPYELENNYYLNRDFYGNPDKEGAICTDYRATFGKRSALSRVTAVYAHSWDDNPDGGGLFAQLKSFRDPEFARAHPYIFFSTAEEDMVWEVFAVFDTTIYLPYVRPSLPQDKFYQTLDMVYGLSYYNYNAAVDHKDRILALSTCTYSVDGHSNLPALNDYRFVVMARLVEPGSPLLEEAVLGINDAPLQPDVSRRLRHL